MCERSSPPPPAARRCGLQQAFATCSETIARRWAFSPRAGECGAARLGRDDIQQLLGGKWVVFAGDSVSRMLYAAALRVAGSKGGYAGKRRCLLQSVAWAYGVIAGAIDNGRACWVQWHCSELFRARTACAVRDPTKRAGQRCERPGAALRPGRRPAGQTIKYKHQDFEYTFDGAKGGPGIRATFLWRAFPSNLTALFTEWWVRCFSGEPGRAHATEGGTVRRAPLAWALAADCRQAVLLAQTAE